MCRILAQGGFHRYADGPSPRRVLLLRPLNRSPTTRPRADRHLFIIPRGRPLRQRDEKIPGINTFCAPTLRRPDSHTCQGQPPAASSLPAACNRRDTSAATHSANFPPARVASTWKERHRARPEGAARLHLRGAPGSTPRPLSSHYFGYTTLVRGRPLGQAPAQGEEG